MTANHAFSNRVGPLATAGLTGLLPLLWLLALPATTGAQVPFAYKIVGNNATPLTIIRYTGPGGDVTIPASIEGLPVTCIAGEAFFKVPR